MTGFRTAIECSTSTMYSRVRVLFDSNQNNTITLNVAMSPIGVKLEKNRDAYLYPSTPKLKDPTTTTEATEVIGDVDLPFWVQKGGSSWTDPDEEFIHEAKGFITLTDKRIFWEMIRVYSNCLLVIITDFVDNHRISGTDEIHGSTRRHSVTPSLFHTTQNFVIYCDTISNAKDLAAALKRPEYKVLWTADAPDYIPKEAASELITAAYVVVPITQQDTMGNI